MTAHCILRRGYISVQRGKQIGGSWLPFRFENISVVYVSVGIGFLFTKYLEKSLEA